MSSPAGETGEIEQLKSLLFRPEATRLETLEADVASLRAYVGDPRHLETATADILVAALTRAEVDHPRELANAVAPSVVTAIRKEIENSRDMMVDALYPITGRLVSAAVGNAFKELLVYLEQRINALTSTELMLGRIKSLATGRPISEFVLSDGQKLRVQRLLMIERGSGRLVADWTREGAANERADMLSAMVAAILEFSVQALAGEGNLQKLDFGGREIVLRASPRFILAAECIGSLRPADDARINGLFFDAVEAMDRGEACDSAMLDRLAGSVDTGGSAAAAGKRGKIIMGVIFALVAVAAGWQLFGLASRALLEHRTHGILQALIDEQQSLQAFPLQLAFEHGEQRVVLSGIVPSDADVVPFLDSIAEVAQPYVVENRVGVIPSLAVTSEIEDLRATVQRLEAQLDKAGAGNPPGAQ